MTKLSFNRFIYLLFDITILSLVGSSLDKLSWLSKLSKIEYIYIFFLVLYVVRTKKLHLNWDGILIFAIMIVYNILFSFVFINQNVVALTKPHFIANVRLILFIFLTTNYIVAENCLMQFIDRIIYIVGALLTLSYLTHFNGLAPFRYFFNVFSSAVRARFPLGWDFVNTAGHLSGSILALSIISIYYTITSCKYKKPILENFPKKVCFILVIDFFAGIVLISTACRTALVGLIFFIAILILLYNWEKVRLLIFPIACFIAILVFKTDVINSIFGQSGREAGTEMNLPIFYEYGHIWTGMGYVENGVFLSQGYGWNTGPVDNQYLYFYLATGIIGTIIMGTALLILIYGVVFKKINKRIDKAFCTALLSFLLFAGCFECSVVSYRSGFIGYRIFWIVCLVFMKKGDETFVEYNGEGRELNIEYI